MWALPATRRCGGARFACADRPSAPPARRYKPQGVNKLDATKCAKCKNKVFAVCKLEAANGRVRATSRPVRVFCALQP
jgi:hypothetical protein